MYIVTLRNLLTPLTAELFEEDEEYSSSESYGQLLTGVDLVYYEDLIAKEVENSFGILIETPELDEALESCWNRITEEERYPPQWHRWRINPR